MLDCSDIEFIPTVPETPILGEEFVRDLRVEMYNYLFKENERPCNQVLYTRAVESLLKAFSDLVARGHITQDMCRDPERGLASVVQLKNLLTYHQDNRFKNRLIKIAYMVMNKQDDQQRAAQLSSWAIAGHYCNVRAEDETYEFYVRNITDASTLENENASLEMRLALSLASLREELLTSIIPQDQHERLHYVGYIKRKAASVLGLIGDVQKFEDQYQNVVVRGRAIRDITAEELKGIVLAQYTPDVLIKYVVREANKRPKESRLPFHVIQKYFLTKRGGYELLKLIYDEDEAFMTEKGACLLLQHFGYLDGLKKSS